MITPAELIIEARKLAAQHYSADQIQAGRTMLALADALEAALARESKLKDELEQTQAAVDDACDDANHNADIGIEWQRRAEKAEAVCRAVNFALPTQHSHMIHCDAVTRNGDCTCGKRDAAHKMGAAYMAWRSSLPEGKSDEAWWRHDPGV